MTPEVAVGIAAVLYPPVSWLIYQVITAKTGLEAMKDTVDKIDKKQDRIIDHLLNR